MARIAQLLSPNEPHASALAGSSTRPAPSSHPTTPSTAALRRRLVPLLIAAVALMAAGYFAFDRFVVSKRVAPPIVSGSTPVLPTLSTIPEKSIAVLPFVDMSEKHDQEYFGDGMAEEILNLLVKIPEIKVIGRTSSFQFKGKTDDLRTICAALGAAYVVEGSVRRSGDHVRVTAQLIDTRDGAQRWSETYDRDVSDVLRVQDEIAASVVRALQLEVKSSTGFKAQRTLRNSDAYYSYLRGLHATDRFDQGGLEESITHFRHALELDPSFVPAAESLARSLLELASWGFAPAETGFANARAAAEATIKLDSTSALGHACLGDVYTKLLDWPATEPEIKTAVALAPNNPRVL